MTRSYDIDLNGPSITCKICGLTSYNVNDVVLRYCARCHRFHDDLNEKTESKSNTQSPQDEIYRLHKLQG